MIFEAVRKRHASREFKTESGVREPSSFSSEINNEAMHKTVLKFNNSRKEAYSADLPKKAAYGRYLPLALLFVQGIATSVDALAVGIGLAVINADIKLSALTIGVTTALVCLPAMYIGKKTGDAFDEKARFAGGCILVGIGMKICVRHLIERGGVQARRIRTDFYTHVHNLRHIDERDEIDFAKDAEKIPAAANRG